MTRAKMRLPLIAIVMLCVYGGVLAETTDKTAKVIQDETAIYQPDKNGIPPKLIPVEDSIQRSDGTAMDKIVEANAALNQDEIVDFDILKPQKSEADGPEGQKRTAILGGRWKGGIIPYRFDYRFPYNLRTLVDLGINDFKKFTCLKWIPKTSEHKAYVTFRSNGTGCNSGLGAPVWGKGEVPINLQPKGCDSKATVIHEMMHAAGFKHEQSRRDRDKYINIFWNNIKSDDRSQNQFKMLREGEANTYNAKYDPESVMHYGRLGGEFSINKNKPIMERKDQSDKPLGNKVGFTQIDIDQVNLYYDCFNARREIEEIEKATPVCSWQPGKYSGTNKQNKVSYDWGAIAGPEDCRNKCWRAGQLKYKFSGPSVFGKIKGATVQSTYGIYKCGCLLSKDEIYPAKALDNYDRFTTYQVCLYGDDFDYSKVSKSDPVTSGRVHGSNNELFVYLGKKQLRCYEAVPSQVFGLLGAISSLTECVERCNMYMERRGEMLVGATWFLEPNNNLQCHCAETKRWRQTRKQAYTCFFQGGAVEAVPTVPPFNPECFEKKSVPGLTQFPFSKESANSPKKCAEQCWKAKIEGGWARDTSGLKASQYKERNGRFVACYCSWTDQYWDDSGWDGSKSTVCIL